MLRKINGNTKPHKVRDQNDRNEHSSVKLSRVFESPRN